MAKQVSRQVSIFLNGNQIENSIKAIAAEQRKANNELAGMIRGTVEYEQKSAELRKINGILAEHRRGLTGVKEGWSLAKLGLDNFVGIAAGAFTVDAILGYGKELFNTAVKMEALEKKARIVFGDVFPKVTEEANKNAAAMGFTTSEYVAAAAAIQDILVPMGFQRQEAAKISTQLTNLSGALSEWTGGQVTATQVSEILASALTGEREQLKQLGIVLQQSDIDARLAEKGLSALSGEMRQQAEAAASLELILEKSQDAQTAYADNADSMTRKTAELSAKFEEIKEVVATALIPVFEGFLNIVDDIGDGLSNLTDPISNIPIAAILKGTKSDAEKTLEGVQKLQQEADELLAKYGIKKEEQGKFDPKAAAKAEEEKKAAEEVAKRRKREAEQAQKDLIELTKRTTELRLDLISKAQDDELAVTIRAIEKRYDAEIEKALELEKKGVTEATAQRIALEHLKNEEIGLAVEADIQKSIETNEKLAKEEAERIAKVKKEALDKDNEERVKYLEDKAAAEDEIKAFTDEQLLNERDLELQQLEDHYFKLLEAAKKYGFDTVAITEAYNKAKNDVIQKYNTDELQLFEAQIELKTAQLQAFSQGAEALAGFFEESSAIGKAIFLFQKAVAAAEVIINLQVEIARIAAGAAALGPIGIPIAAAQIAAAKIRAGFGLAAIAATAIKPFVKQKYTGSYLDVTGADDGRAYRARTIAAPPTGLLPDYPVLFHSRATGAPVLASERGREYFVSADALRNPTVANLTRMIDNIAYSGGRVTQFAEGGANTATPTSAPVGIDMRVIEKNTAVMEAVLQALQRGIVAVVPDSTVLDIDRRFKKINVASGGYYG